MLVYSQAVVLVFAFFIQHGNTLECYVCRGCATVNNSDIQTCPSSIVPTTDNPEGTTDSDSKFGKPRDVALLAAEVPWLEEADFDFTYNAGSEVLKKMSRRSAKATGDDARCVIAVYEEASGSKNVIRKCSTASANPNTRCQEAVGDSTLKLDYCNLCEEDLCNSASRTAVTILSITFALLCYLF